MLYAPENFLDDATVPTAFHEYHTWCQQNTFQTFVLTVTIQETSRVLQLTLFFEESLFEDKF